MKVAIIHDWLVTLGGAEKVLQAILKIYPHADIFTLVAKDDLLEQIGVNKERVTTSFIQRFPKATSKWRSYLPFFPLAIEQFDLSAYDLVLSSSFCVAKGVLTNSEQLHITYCHSPVRYAWDLHYQYLRESGLDKGLKGWLAKYLLHRLRNWDALTAPRVDHFISNSNYIGRRIKRVYGREATTIYPNVAVEDFELQESKGDFYFTCSRMVPYKKIDLIVEAFSQMPDKRLVVIGDGPDFDKIKAKAGENVDLLGFQSFEVLKDHMKRAKAFVFAADEDFGIVPVEAQASGTPVLAYGKGGSLETVKEGETGLFFAEQHATSIRECVLTFEKNQSQFVAKDIRLHAEKFSEDRFIQELKKFIDEKLANR
ncbi:hypothetical protein PEDI_25500 [Persicobacter diffluens]|uniref:Glycosyl transferase family 1 domain-containing protein n=1 Tax=Persicobacter diffluens TaxID=981 RepID=A0AAN4VZV3_9BACT|nr:hypothetical protein PEDI_25500 [Persicobacter diffluens]